MKRYCLIVAAIFASGCVKQMPIESVVKPNQVVTEVVEPTLPGVPIAATYGVGDDPAVIKAYEQYVKSGHMASINRKGFKTLAYEANSHPILACEPLHLCVIQLESGENINDIALGDSINWLVNTALVGTPQNGAYQIAVKPKTLNLATDMIVTTTRRTYNIGLVSQQGKTTHVVNFYYPQETLQHAIQKAQQLEHTETVTENTQVNLTNLNFNYDISGSASWRPSRVFDDGDKTFIEMPAISSRVDLPVLYLQRHDTQQLVNYRYKAPYYIIDSLFQTAVLVTGNGRDQDKVTIQNRRTIDG